MAEGRSNRGKEFSPNFVQKDVYKRQAEAISALVVLGYSQSEAAVAVGQCDPALPVEEMIKFGLKKLATNL